MAGSPRLKVSQPITLATWSVVGVLLLLVMLLRTVAVGVTAVPSAIGGDACGYLCIQLFKLALRFSERVIELTVMTDMTAAQEEVIKVSNKQNCGYDHLHGIQADSDVRCS